MRISDWSSDVCSSDLLARGPAGERANMAAQNKGPGGKQPTINDVAALAGVSKKTVSRVINRSEFLTDKTRAAVEKAIEQLGFVPNPQARALAFRRNLNRKSTRLNSSH